MQFKNYFLYIKKFKSYIQNLENILWIMELKNTFD